MQESNKTGVIYKISNTIDGKMYIGRANSEEKHGKGKHARKPSNYGALGRFRRHMSNANSEDPKKMQECPAFYKAIIDYKETHGLDCWNYETIEVCLKKDLQAREEFHILKNKSYMPEFGYNRHIGNKKPIAGANKVIYEKMKREGNKRRAKNSALKRTEASKKLPANIYLKKRPAKEDEDAEIVINKKGERKRVVVDGYRVQIKVSKKVGNETVSISKNKAFSNKDLTMDEKLELAKDFLAKVKKEYNEDN